MIGLFQKTRKKKSDMDEKEKQIEMWEELGILLDEWKVLEEKLKAYKAKWNLYPITMRKENQDVSESGR